MNQTSETTELAERVLPAGSVVKVNGIPLELAEDTKVRASAGNFEVIDELGLRSLLDNDFEKAVIVPPAAQ